ncbi:MAG TPA: ATP-binding protein, partial [Chloroflexota bacterium]|nr:ATP-binding protein [Chloroflexota bacterium]
ERHALSTLREEVDLAAILREVCSQPLGDLHCCRLLAPETIPARVDPVRIRQLFDNLVENAVKYSPEGGEVIVCAQPSLSSVDVTVTDQGIGIAPEDVPYVFERFRRGLNVNDRRFPGMGLGLYICRGIVEEHGGRIWATSSQGAGTTIHVWLPLDQEAE